MKLSYETWPQVSRRMRKIRKRGPRGKKNVKDGKYFHFLRSADSQKKLRHPVTGNRVMIRSLAGSKDRRVRRLFKREHEKFRRKWKQRLNQKKENQLAKKENRKPKSIKLPPKEKQKKPRMPFRPSWMPTRNKKANIETSVLEVLQSVIPGNSKKFGFRYHGSDYLVIYGNTRKEHFVHFSILEGVPDPSFVFGKFIGSPSYIVMCLRGMPKVMQLISFTANRVAKSLDDAALPFSERLRRRANLKNIKGFKMNKKSSLSALQSVVLKLVNYQMSKGKKDTSPYGDILDVEMEGGLVLEEASKTLKTASDMFYRDSSEIRRIRAALIISIAKSLKAAWMLGKVEKLRKEEDFFRNL